MAAATREGASTMEGTKMTTGDANTSRTESPGPAKMVGAKKKKYRHELCYELSHPLESFIAGAEVLRPPLKTASVQDRTLDPAAMRMR